MAGKVIFKLPNDFWRQEVLGWEQEQWAAMQIMMSQYAIGPKASDPLADGYWIKPVTEGEKALCGAQKMRKSGEFVYVLSSFLPTDHLTNTHTSNINVFGLSFVIVFSLLVALIDITLLRFLIYLSCFRRALGPRLVRWTQDGVWQLQHRAYEGEGHKKMDRFGE